MKYILPVVFTMSLLFVLYTNYLANALPINNVTTGEISDKYFTLITPASTAFSIWVLIYVSLLAFIGKLWYDYFKDDLENILVYKRILPFFIIHCLANMLWLIMWHHEKLYLSLALMLILLISLIFIYKEIKGSQVWQAPWEIYLGWISVATFVNIAVMFVSSGINTSMGDPVIWTQVMLIVATALSIFFLIKERSYYFSMVNVWAIFHIAIANKMNDSLYYFSLGLILLQFLLVWAHRSGILNRKKSIDRT